MSVPDHKGLRVRNVVSMLSHRVVSRARLYERVSDHCLLRGGVGGKNRETQGVIINVHHSSDDYVCAACVATHIRGYVHAQGTTVCVLTCERLSSPCRSSYSGGLGYSNCTCYEIQPHSRTESRGTGTGTFLTNAVTLTTWKQVKQHTSLTRFVEHSTTVEPNTTTKNIVRRHFCFLFYTRPQIYL